MNNSLEEILNRLHKVVELEKRREGLKRFFIALASISLFYFLIIALEALFSFGSTARKFIFFTALTASFVSFGIYVVLPFIKDLIYYKHPDYIKTAKIVGDYFPQIKDGLANAIQLVSENNPGYSAQLIESAFRNIFNKSKELNFNSSVDFSETKKMMKFGGIITAIVFIVILFAGGLNSAAYRLINYDKNFLPPPRFIFEINPGNVEVTKGDNVQIDIKVSGERISEIDFYTMREEQSEFEPHKIKIDSLGFFSFKSANVKSTFEYFASAYGVESERYKISVVNRPIISSLDLTVIPPAYSKLEKIIQRDNGNITALAGSKALIKLNSSRELSKAIIQFGDSTKHDFKLNDNTASIDFYVKKEDNYKIYIEDAQKISNINPITYFIKIIKDENPSIELISPPLASGETIKLQSNSKVPVTAIIKDDFGFTKLNLNYKISSSKYRAAEENYTAIPMLIKNESKEDEVYFNWDLSPLVLAEGEAVSCFLEVFDNDIVSGPKAARTQMFSVVVPSLDEIFAGAENKQQESSKELAEALAEAEKLKLEMQKIGDDLKKNNRELSWQEKERIEKAAEKFKDLMKKTDDASQKLSEMKNELEQNNLLSKETMEKYNGLQDLLDQLSSEEMKKAFERMQESLKNLLRDNAQMSFEDLKANEEFFRKSLERTVNLLKRIQIEQKIDELIKRTEDITDKLDELKDKTNKANLSDKQKQNELTKRQDDLSKNLDDLKDEMEKLSKKMEEMSDLPKDQLDKSIEEFSKQKNLELSEEAKNNLSQMQKSKALQNQEKLSENMKSMNKQFQDLQSAMQQMNQMKTFYDMMKVLDDLLTLSKNQEELKNETERLNSNSPELLKNSRKQNELQNGLSKVLQKLTDLSQKTFAISPEMGRALGNAYTQMQQSISAMQNQNTPLANQMQKQAMAHLNEAASLIKGGMDQMMMGGQGGGMMSMMQQMQQLSQQQFDLNKLTQRLNQGQLSQEMAAQMQRLSQQQELIRKSLEQLNREARETGQSKKLASNLEKILQDMKEVVSNLQSEKIDDELIKQQEKILSRMLDAQRSINERDFEKDRKSETGNNINRISPPDLILSTEEGKNKLKDELMKAIREGYKKDYEDLIRKYFEALIEKEKVESTK